MADEETITDVFPEFGSRSRSEPEPETAIHRQPPDLTLTLGFEDDDFFIGRRTSAESDPYAFESDSESDGQIVAIGDNNDPNPNPNFLSLRWDCLHVDREPNEEFEWEEIDNHDDDDETSRNVEWEFLLAMNNNNNNNSRINVIEEDEGFVYTTSENGEILLGQFEEGYDSLLKGGPPAAKSVVEMLPSIVFKGGDVGDGVLSCAVCKDEIGVEEKAKRLPCSHCYHEECILTWLGMRNTCPLCRYELPTDDVEYESWKVRREEEEADARVRYDFEILPEA